MTVVVGELLSADGIASRQQIGDDWRTRTVAWANPACELRHAHELPIPVTVDEHDGEQIGQVIGVHRAKGWGGIVAWAVAELDGDDRLLEFPGPVYFSAECDHAVRPGSAIGHDIRLRAVALTTTPARLCAEPVLLLPGRIRERRRWSLNGRAAAAVDETLAQLPHRGDGTVLYVTGSDDGNAAYHARATTGRPDLYYRPHRIEHSRHVGKILRVS